MSNDSVAETIDPLRLAELPTGPYMGGFRRGAGMARKRIPGFPGTANAFHVMSRTAGGERLFGDVEKEAFTRIMRRLERFAGVQILTYAIMGNHFHLLLRVPDQAQFLTQFQGEDGEERLFSHLRILYSKRFVASLRHELDDLRKQGMQAAADELIGRFHRRFCNLECYVKELKERFSRWFNKHHGRRGTLWMERFKSVIVENGDALRTMAAYIDLNPVRAGICDDPKDYRWCGYAEAVAGGEDAQRGLCQVMGQSLTSWKVKPTKNQSGLTTSERYRCWLFGEGLEVADQTGQTKRRGMSQDAVEEVRSNRGKLSRSELLRCRVRYFTDGVAIGSRAYVESLYHMTRKYFGKHRKDGARRVRESEPVIYSLRALRVRALEGNSEDSLH